MIYLDHHASTPVSDAARRAMAKAEPSAWANPSSVHGAGRAAKALVERARLAVANAIGAQPADVVLAGGGTEACNLGIFGLTGALGEGADIVVTELEHPAVEQSLQQLVASQGARLTRLPARQGRPANAHELEALLPERAQLCVSQWVNHETGTIFPIEDYARVCSARGVPLLVDASQGFGKLPLDVSRLGASAVVLTSSKIGGPAGASALWVERCRDFAPLLFGGAQERGRRPGTPSVSCLVGFGAAAEALPERLMRMGHVEVLRDRLERALVDLGAQVNGAEGPRVASVSNVSISGWRGDILVAALDVEGLCASSGAACSSGLGAPSPVLRAMYPDEPVRAESALRLSLSVETTESEVEQAIHILRRVLGRARA